MKKKILVAIADGLGDRPIAQFGGKSPLQQAHTPHLDLIATQGKTGLMDPISPGITVGTDMGHLVLFGHLPNLYPGRGPIEAAGVGLTLKTGDIAFRCNFATVDNGIVKDRRAGRIRQGTSDLVEAINGIQIEDVTFHVKAATEHRAVLLMRGAGLSDAVSDTDPKAPNDGAPWKLAKALDDRPASKKTARLLNTFLKHVQVTLEKHDVNVKRKAQGLLPANALITRGAGQFASLPQLSQTMNFHCKVIAGEDTVLGVAKLSGYDTETDISFTGSLDTNVILKAQKSIDALQDHDLVYVHFKATDLMGHDNSPEGKVKAIEKYDEMIAYLLNHLPNNTLIALTADHSTPCEKGEHSGEPIPVAVMGPGIFADLVHSYDEVACANGMMGRLNGHDFIWSLLDYLEIIPKQGN